MEKNSKVKTRAGQKKTELSSKKISKMEALAKITVLLVLQC